MPKELNIDEFVKYWSVTAAHDYETMLGLYKIKRYSDCLFYGHIVLEKILKAAVVKQTKQHAPFIHDLVRLYEVAKLELGDDMPDELDKINEFNIRARYPDYKNEFYKKCDKKYADKYMAIIKNIYLNLCQKLKQKK